MNKLIGAIFTAAFLMSSYAAQANECAVHYVRTACPGKEAISYKKCDGKQECTKIKEASSVEKCRKAATKSCSNSRFDITKSKVITAMFNGAPIKTASGKDDFCLEYENRSTEFNQCDK